MGVSGQRGERAVPLPTWVSRLLGWLDDSTDGISWLLWLCAFFSAFGFSFFPIDLNDRNQADSLRSRGEWTTATSSEVRVDYVGGRGGGYHEVDEVRVRLEDGSVDVPLENVNAVSDSIYDDVRQGWQSPTEITGYQPPFDVRVRRDGRGSVVMAMAREDYEYWTQDNSDPEIGLSLGFGGLGVAVVALTLNSLRLRRPSRGQARSRAELRHRVATTGKRAAPPKRGRKGKVSWRA